MSEILSRAQPYIQLEEEMKTSSNYSAKPTTTREVEVCARSLHHAQDQNRGQLAYKRQALLILSPNLLRAYKPIEQFTQLRLPVNEIFNTIKDQRWVRRSRPAQYDLSHSRAKKCCSYHDGKGHKTIYYWSS